MYIYANVYMYANDCNEIIHIGSELRRLFLGILGRVQRNRNMWMEPIFKDFRKKQHYMQRETNVQNHKDKEKQHCGTYWGTYIHLIF